MSFIKTKEDFICENCGVKVKGNGYTNHCPNCLYSKHVDIKPGDRLCDCSGLMKPIEIIKKGEEISIMHSCLKCGVSRKNKSNPQDNMNLIINLSINKK